MNNGHAYPWQLQKPPPVEARFAGEGLLQVFAYNRLDFLKAPNSELMAHLQLMYTIPLTEWCKGKRVKTTAHSFLELSMASATGFFDGTVLVNNPSTQQYLNIKHWEITSASYVIPPGDEPYPVIQTCMNPVEPCWVASVKYRPIRNDYIISVHDVAQPDPEGDGYKRIFAISHTEKHVGVAWFFDNADMLVVVTSKAIRIFEISAGTEPKASLFVTCELFSVCVNPHRATVFACLIKDAVLIFDRRLLWCPTHTLPFRRRQKPGQRNQIRFNPMRGDEIFLQIGHSTTVSRLFISSPGDFHFMSTPPHRVRSESSYLELSALADEDRSPTQAFIEKRTDFAPSGPKGVEKPTKVPTFAELPPEEKEMAHCWARLYADTKGGKRPSFRKIKVTKACRTRSVSPRKVTDHLHAQKRSSSCIPAFKVKKKKINLRKITVIRNIDRPGARTSRSSFSSDTLARPSTDRRASTSLAEDLAKKRKEEEAAKLQKKARIAEERMRKFRIAHKLAARKARIRKDSLARRMHEMNIRQKITFPNLRRLGMFEFSPFSAAVIGCGIDRFKRFHLDTIMPIEYPDTWGADKYSSLTIKKVRFCSVYTLMGRDMYKLAVDRAKRGAVNFSVEPGVDRLIDMKLNSLDIFMESASPRHQLFFHWYSLIFDLVHSSRPLPEKPKKPAAKKPEPVPVRPVPYSQPRRKLDSEFDACSVLTCVSEESIVESSSEGEHSSGDGSYGTDDIDKDSASDTAVEEDTPAPRPELAFFELRGLPGLIQLASHPPTKAEKFDNGPFGNIKLYTGPERIAILRSVGMPSPYERKAIRKIARKYFDKDNEDFRPYTCIFIAMMYGAYNAVNEMFDELVAAYGKQFVPGSIDDRTGGPIGQCRSICEMWTKFKEMQSRTNQNELTFNLTRWMARHKELTRAKAQPELHACLYYMAAVLDRRRMVEHRQMLCTGLQMPISLRTAFCALYLPKDDLIQAFCIQMRQASDLSKLVFVGLGPHPDSIQVVLEHADATQDCQLATFLLLTGECIATPVNDPELAQDHVRETKVIEMSKLYPSHYLKHEKGHEKLYQSRMRVIIDRYLNVLTSAKLHIMRCALHGLLYPPKQRKDAWWSISCSYCYEPIVGAKQHALDIQQEKDEARRSERLRTLAMDHREARTSDEQAGIKVPTRTGHSAMSHPYVDATKIIRSMCCPMPMCRQQYPKCSICLRSYGTPIIGYDHDMGYEGAHAFAFCLRCEHGGHGGHMMDWFKSSDKCPICDCRCIEYKDLNPVPVTKKQDLWTRGLHAKSDDELQEWVDKNQHLPLVRRMIVPAMPEKEDCCMK